MGQNQYTRMIEDVEFGWGGYAKVTVDMLVQGDGVRFNSLTPCQNVMAIEKIGSLVELTLVDRRVVVQEVVAHLGRDLDDGSIVASAESVIFDADRVVWVRL